MFLDHFVKRYEVRTATTKSHSPSRHYQLLLVCALDNALAMSYALRWYRHKILCLSSSERCSMRVQWSLQCWYAQQKRRKIESSMRCASEKCFVTILIFCGLLSSYSERFWIAHKLWCTDCSAEWHRVQHSKASTAGWLVNFLRIIANVA